MNQRSLTIILTIAVPSIVVFALGFQRHPAPETHWVAPDGEADQDAGGKVYFDVAMFNIRRGKNSEGVRNLDGTASVLKGCDIAFLNEVSGGMWGAPDQSERLGDKLGLDSYFLTSQRRYFQDYFGNAVLTRFPIREWQSMNLKKTNGQGHRHIVTMKSNWNGRIVTLILTHLDGDADRARQLDRALTVFRTTPAPAILAGDFNTTRSDPALAAALEGGVIDALGIGLGENDPLRRKDWILVKGFSVQSAEVIEEFVSDHPCFRATLAFSDRMSKATLTSGTDTLPTP